MKYFRSEEDPAAKLPKNFITGFLEVCEPLVKFRNCAELFHREEIESKEICLSLYIARTHIPWRHCCAIEKKRPTKPDWSLMHLIR